VSKLKLCLIILAALAWLLAMASWAMSAPVIPQRAAQHRALLTREARAQWGLDAPVATFAAQIHQESAWRHDAVSPVGAQGLAQFMPSTSRWLPEVAPDTGEPKAVFRPAWSIRAMVTYDRWLWRTVPRATDCDRIAMTLPAYTVASAGCSRSGPCRVHRMNLGCGPRAMVNAGRSAAKFKEIEATLHASSNAEKSIQGGRWG
jgi:hypothetical protein